VFRQDEVVRLREAGMSLRKIAGAVERSGDAGRGGLPVSGQSTITPPYGRATARRQKKRQWTRTPNNRIRHCVPANDGISSNALGDAPKWIGVELFRGLRKTTF